MNNAPASGACKTSGAKLPGGPNCFQCRHFAISWQPSMPYACRLFGFKSKALPAIEILRIDGRICQGFTAKLPLTSKQSVNKLA
jgi:hypothetical protein